MSEERLMQQGRLAELKQRKLELTTRIKANLKACAMALANYRVDAVKHIDVDGMAVNAMEAKTLKAQYMEVDEQITLLEEDLHGIRR